MVVEWIPLLGWVAGGGASVALAFIAGRRSGPAPQSESPRPLPAQPAAPVDLEALLKIVAVDGVKASLDVAQVGHQMAMETMKFNSEMRQKTSKRLGGKVRAKTATRNSKGQMQARCRLCKDSQAWPVSYEEITAHEKHRAGIADAPEEKERIPIHVQTLENGDQIAECSECGDPDHSAAHHNN